MRRAEHQKAAAPGAHELAADAPVRPGELVPLVDLGVAHLRRSLLLVLPVLVHEAPEIANRPALERTKTADSKLLHVVQVLEHFLVVVCGALPLGLEDVSGPA